LSSFVGQAGVAYNPEKPLADSLGELATSLKGLPDTFVEMSVNLSTTDNNLAEIRGNLTTMSESVGLISSSLTEYQNMVIQSQSSMDNLSTMLTNVKNNLAKIIDAVVIIFTLLLLWFLATQVVILTQGWELYQGTADRMEGKSE
jgi:methyl-accepting chemotaxis protein